MEERQGAVELILGGRRTRRLEMYGAELFTRLMLVLGLLDGRRRRGHQREHQGTAACDKHGTSR